MAQSSKLFKSYQELHGTPDPQEISFETAYAAAEKGELIIVRYWVERNLDKINQALPATDYSLLHVAAANGKTNVVDYLISQKAYVDQTSYRNKNDNLTGSITPLHLACFHGHLEVVKSLVNAKASVNLQSHGWRSSIHHALLSPRPEAELTEIVKYLLNNGLNPFQAAWWDNTGADRRQLLEFAVQAGKNSLYFLIVNKINEISQLPLKYAQLEEDFKKLQLSVQAIIEENKTLKADVERLKNPTPPQPYITDFADFNPRSFPKS